MGVPEPAQAPPDGGDQVVRVGEGTVGRGGAPQYRPDAFDRVESRRAARELADGEPVAFGDVSAHPGRQVGVFSGKGGSEISPSPARSTQTKQPHSVLTEVSCSCGECGQRRVLPAAGVTHQGVEAALGLDHGFKGSLETRQVAQRSVHRGALPGIWCWVCHVGSRQGLAFLSAWEKRGWR